jgi:hypothetical protein
MILNHKKGKTMEILEFINTLPKRKERTWSFLETIGIAQREVPIANLLGYYFNPTKEHGLQDLFIKALLETDCYELIKKTEFKVPDEIRQFRDENFIAANVILEDRTENNKRIDLVIETEKLVIAIEFKINHRLNNPLNDYVEKMAKQYKGRPIYYLVLTPMWKMPEGKAVNNKEFKQVILSKFIKNVSKLKKNGDYRCANPEQECFYKDFINMIENRAKMNEMMKEYYVMFNNNDEKYKELESKYDDLNDIKKNIESKVEELSKELKGFKIIKGSTKLDSAICKQVGDHIQIKIRLSPKGWFIEKWKKFKREESIYLCAGFDDVDIEKIREFENSWL